MSKIIQALSNQPWLIEKDSLETICSIAEERQGQSLEVLQSKLGRPLENTREVTQRGNTAIIPVNGPIFRYANLFTRISGATSTEILAQDFASANDNPEIEKIVLEIDSPGGQAPGIAELASIIRSSEKEVIAYIDGMGASAAYWIASAADKVFISRSAEAGSIGAVFAVRTDNDSGTITIVSKQSPKKRLDPKTADGIKDLQDRIDNLAEVFVKDVAEFRGVTMEKVLADFGQGGLLLGQAAVDAGLADRVTTFESLFKEEVEMSGKSNQGITLEAIRADHPEVAESLRKQGYDEGFAAGKIAGKDAEVARIQSVREQSIPGHEALIETLMFDGKSTGADAAMAIVRAEKTARTSAADNFRKEAPAPVDQPSTDDGKKEKTPETLDEQWDANADGCQDEFHDKEAFVAFKQAENAGLVKIRGGK